MPSQEDGLHLPTDLLPGVEDADVAVQARQATIRLHVPEAANAHDCFSGPFPDDRVATGFLVSPNGLAVVPSHVVRRALTEPYAWFVRRAMEERKLVFELQIGPDDVTCSEFVDPSRTFVAWRPSVEAPLPNLKVSRLFSFQIQHPDRHQGWLAKARAVFGTRKRAVYQIYDDYPRSEQYVVRDRGVGSRGEHHCLGFQRLHAKLAWLASFPRESDGQYEDFPVALVRLYERHRGVQRPLTTGPWIPLADEPIVPDAPVVIAGHPCTERAVQRQQIEMQRAVLQAQRAGITAVQKVIAGRDAQWPDGLQQDLARHAARTYAQLVAVEKRLASGEWPAIAESPHERDFSANEITRGIVLGRVALEDGLRRCAVRYDLPRERLWQLDQALSEALPQDLTRAESKATRVTRMHMGSPAERRSSPDGSGHLRLRIGRVAGRTPINGCPTRLATNADLSEGDQGAAVIDPEKHVALGVVTDVSAGARFHYSDVSLEWRSADILMANQVLAALNETSAELFAEEIMHQAPKWSSLVARRFRAAPYRR